MIPFLWEHLTLFAALAVVVAIAWMFPPGRVSPWRCWDPRSGARGASIAGVCLALVIITLYC